MASPPRWCRPPTDGVLDPTFGTNGVLEIPATQLNFASRGGAVLPDGSRILYGVGIGQGALIKLTAARAVDLSLGQNGVKELPMVTPLLIGALENGANHLKTSL
jgi:hypothetical protein